MGVTSQHSSRPLAPRRLMGMPAGRESWVVVGGFLEVFIGE